MTDTPSTQSASIVERLHTIRAHLRTGALGQREAWEAWLTEAAAEIERLTALVIEAEKYNGYHQLACLEVERLRAALEEIIAVRYDPTDRAAAIARRALEPKP